MYISNATLVNGRSHINPATRGGSKINILTDEGREYFAKKQARCNEAVKNNAQEFYRNFLQEELKEIDDDLTFFLNDEEMCKLYAMSEKDKDRTGEGWQIYNTMLDQYNILKYFIKKIS